MDKEGYEANLTGDIIKAILSLNGEKYLSSVVLTGSFGRGEPTYQAADGALALKSDVEIALVYKGGKTRRETEKIIESVGKQFKEDLNLMALSKRRMCKAQNFNFSFRSPRYKTLFTFDLFNGSRTMWGEKLIEQRTVGLKSVDLYEARRIVANRIGELNCLSHSAESDYVRKQWKGKLTLAIVSAWLLCEGIYVSSYHEQKRIFEKNAEAAAVVLGDSFARNYYNVFAFLREAGAPYEIPEHELRDYVRRISGYLDNRKIFYPKVNSISRKLKYFFKYFKTSGKLGWFNFEDKILQKLIDEYADNGDELADIAQLWHKVLY
jgi:hypothetical protein